MDRYFVHTSTGEIEKAIFSNKPWSARLVGTGAAINISMTTGDFGKSIWASISACESLGHRLVSEGAYTVLHNAIVYCPKDTTALANSGVVKDSSESFRTNRAAGYEYQSAALEYTSTVMFGVNKGERSRSGSLPSEYAYIVHEDLNMSHPNGGQAKFLERAWREYLQSEWRPSTIKYVEDIRNAYMTGRKGSKYLTYSSLSSNYLMPISNPTSSNENALRALYATNRKRG